jgi:3-oxoacyl-[acyl-carrier protein] reductase
VIDMAMSNTDQHETRRSAAAIVTGGAQGIGAAITACMLEAGYDVICLDMRKPDVTHERLYYRDVDLRDVAATKQTAEDAAGAFGITHVVHNAGAVRAAALGDISQDDLVALAQLHLGAAIGLVQPMIEQWKADRFGRIVLVSSRAALGAPGRSVYSATKAGMIALAKSWALELAAFGVTVNVVAPGPIAGTGMFQQVAGHAEIEKKVLQAIPAGRAGSPGDVARAVMFFADRANAFVTGQTLYVCGGTSIGNVPA